ncbi:MAG: alpha-E domain-containing protein [Leptospiraceae bacterium]|nr:alpha-E domain-containing protein [Leptospiraceae bacterium]
MLSRVADSIYWMNRYIERAENYARFITANLLLILDLPDRTQEQWEPLIFTTGDNELFSKLYAEASRETVLEFLIQNPDNPSSIGSCIARARENARHVREVLSLEIWQQTNEFHMQLRDYLTDFGSILSDPVEFCNEVKKQCHLFHGYFDTSISHSEGWLFGMLGRQLERADKITRLLDVKYFVLLPDVHAVGSSLDLLQWSAILKSASAHEMYYRKYNQLSPASIVEFLVLDGRFPRSIRFCVSEAENAHRVLTGSQPASFSNETERRLGQLRSNLDYAGVEDVFRQGLHEYLDDIQIGLNNIGDSLAVCYFQSD